MANVLRYPYEALTEKTDYLQITLIDRNFAGKDAGLIRNAGFANVGGTRKVRDVSSRRGNPSSREVLTSGGIILLPMPSSIVDANSVNYSEDSLDAITATVAGGALNLMGISADEPQFLEKLGTTGVKFATDLLKGGDLNKLKLMLTAKKIKHTTAMNRFIILEYTLFLSSFFNCSKKKGSAAYRYACNRMVTNMANL